MWKHSKEHSPPLWQNGKVLRGHWPRTEWKTMLLYKHYQVVGWYIEKHTFCLKLTCPWAHTCYSCLSCSSGTPSMGQSALQSHDLQPLDHTSVLHLQQILTPTRFLLLLWCFVKYLYFHYIKLQSYIWYTVYRNSHRYGHSSFRTLVR